MIARCVTAVATPPAPSDTVSVRSGVLTCPAGTAWRVGRNCTAARPAATAAAVPLRTSVPDAGSYWPGPDRVPRPGSTRMVAVSVCAVLASATVTPANGISDAVSGPATCIGTPVMTGAEFTTVSAATSAAVDA